LGLIFQVSCVPFLLPPPCRAFKKRMKLESGLKASFKPLRFVTPLYAKLHEIGNGGPIT
jgi:hypothetical protein